MSRVVVLAISVALLAIPSVGSSSAVAAKPKCAGLVATKVGTNKSQVIRGTQTAGCHRGQARRGPHLRRGRQ